MTSQLFLKLRGKYLLVNPMNFNPLRGMRDFEPGDMIVREKIIEIAKSVFERYGFDPLETPSIERTEILTGKYGEDEKLIWRFKDLGGRDVALRYDLTVPLARFVAKKKRLPLPFKRYQIGRVWRYDNPQHGRYREFWQCDIDTVGSKDVYSDAEIINVIDKSLKKMGIEDFIIRVNSRKVSDEILKSCGVPDEKTFLALRAIDKMDKIGADGVREELTKAGLDADKILDILTRKIDDIPLSDSTMNEINALVDYLNKMNVRYKIDLSVVRGLDYYTGTVFEAAVRGSDVGSISGGGRYGNLIGIFLGQNIPAVGGSLGIERINDILSHTKKTKKDVLLIPVGIEKKDVLDVAERLRKKYNVDISIKSSTNKSLQYAKSVGINKICFVGKKELSERKVLIKDFDGGEEEFTF